MTSTQNNATIFSLQSYITELTCYINENNAKYTKNLQTLKTFYESQIQELQIKAASISDDNHIMRNDLLATKDLLNNRQKQLADMKVKLSQNLNQNQKFRQKLYNQRQKIDELYEEMERVKKDFRKQLDRQDSLFKESDNEKNDLLLKLKDREQEISRLNKDIQKLQDMVSQRYSLPQKLKDIQLQSTKNKTLLQILTEAKRQLQTKLDFQTNQLQRLRKQNQRLQINFEKLTANAKTQINQAIAKQKQQAQDRQKRLESSNQKQLFEITQLQNTLKLMKKQNSQLEKRLAQYVEESKHLQQRILSHDTQKDKYIEEFQKLKKQYEEVIQNLQDAIPRYQKKNWDLEQENRDLNLQLDGLRDLLSQVRAMNTLQPLKQQYRQIAELELLAQKDYQFYRAEKKVKQQSKKNHQEIVLSPTKGPKDDTDFRWDKLLAEIDNIQVS